MCLADGEEDEGDMEKDLPFIKHSPHVRRWARTFIYLPHLIPTSPSSHSVDEETEVQITYPRFSVKYTPKSSTQYIYIFFCTGLFFELRPSHLVGRCCITWATPPPILAFFFFCFGFFWDKGSCLCLGRPGLRYSYLCFPWSWDDRKCRKCHHTQLFIGWDWFAWAGLRLWSSNLCLQSS
jgi:hypothetical protein